ncbi:hypothetical protein BOX15_Mlig011947g1 [Macrostomum lignano]|uniref:Polypeptide N-acetylgalactosaminyltransferase n=1 Tax=Macrostomum lignano TaxID=282301 RepID=A0A267EH10_9PLAT|nr:hypothetical protein BOX15_Mlig011947g1 [Macrostomum lignano]
MRRKQVTQLKILALVIGCLFVMLVVFHGNSVPSDLADQGSEGGNNMATGVSFSPPLGAGDASDRTEDPNELIDWHDYKAIEAERARQGPGEQGKGVHLDASENKAADDLFRVNGFNALVSDKMSLFRSLADIRHSACQGERYRRGLPTASIIIPFHEEHWSTLLRTVVSCIHRAPRHLVKEVILVDDFSKKSFLGDPLEKYVSAHFTNVRVLRNAKREGLIRTRIFGARNATGDVLIFLDSHCECNINWLPPLLHPIANNYKTVVCPFIDVIDFNTFAYRAQDEGARGAFDWEFYYKRLPLLPEDLKHPSKPFDSPVMAGGLFAISTKWFWELGGYDPGLDIWGGEQYELSFKIWQCGGRMVDTGCSRIGHVYRKYAPFPNPGVGDFIGRNYRRVAEVWMDEYAEYIYNRRPHYKSIPAGDLTSQREIRERLHCKPFKWFMTNVAFDLPLRYPPVEPPSAASGEIRSAADASLCIDTRFKGGMQSFGLAKCIKGGGGLSGEQNFIFTFRKDIHPADRAFCFDVSQHAVKAPVILYQCHYQKGNQHWKINPNTGQLYHVASRLCLDSEPARLEIFMNSCNPARQTQLWKWGTTDAKQLERDWANN